MQSETAISLLDMVMSSPVFSAALLGAMATFTLSAIILIAIEARYQDREVQERMATQQLSAIPLKQQEE